MSGIAAVKVSRYEGWGSNLGVTAGAAAAIDRLSRLEGKLQITIEKTPPTIDVTPSKARASTP